MGVSIQGNFRVIAGEQISQHQVAKRIETIKVYLSGDVEICTEGGKAAAVFHQTKLPKFPNETAFNAYLDQVFWIATQAVGHDEYFVTAFARGLGGGVGSSKTPKMSPELDSVFNRIKKQKPDATVTDLLLMVMPSEDKWPIFYSEDGTSYVWPHVQWVKELLVWGADPNGKLGGKSALWMVCNGYLSAGSMGKNPKEDRAIAIADLLISAGADKAVKYQGNPIIHRSIVEKAVSAHSDKGFHVKLFNFLLQNEIDVNDTDSEGHTLLELSIASDNAYAAGALIKAGADVNKGDPLTSALNKNMEQVAIDIIEAGVNLKVEGQNKNKPFTLAIRHGLVRVVKLLLTKGYTPADGVHLAFVVDMNVFNYLIGAGASVDHVDSENPLTCLQKLCASNYWDKDTEEKLRVLLKLKADDTKVERETLEKLPEHIQKLLLEK